MSNNEELSRFTEEVNSLLTKEEADKEVAKRAEYLNSLTTGETGGGVTNGD